MNSLAARFRSLRFIAVAAFAVLGASAAGASELRPFSAESLDELRAAHRGQAFVVAFWSVTCEPCLQELPLLAALHRRFPRVPVVLVAADAPRFDATVRRRLKAVDLGGIETWRFADEFAEKIRFAIDRRWRGELPRTYFFNARHEVEVRTGILSANETAAWFARAGESGR